MYSKKELRENRARVYGDPTKSKANWIILMIAVLSILLISKPLIGFHGIGKGIGYLALTLIISLAIIVIPSQILKRIKKTKAATREKVHNTSNMIMSTVISTIGIALVFFLMILPALHHEPMLTIMLVIGIICIGVMMVFVKFMPKRTEYGREMLGKVKGLRTFLETAGRSQLVDLSTSNPDYFYEILPYAYALGVSNKWIKNFETIEVSNPKWFQSTQPFDMNQFERFIKKAINSI